MRSFWNRPLGSKLILVLSLALLVEMLAPWQRICAAGGTNADNICGWRTAYSGSSFGTYAGIARRRDPRLGAAARPSSRGSPCAAGRPRSSRPSLSVALVVCVLVKMIEDNEFQTGWAWIGLALALAIMLIALIRVRHRWGTRARARVTPESRPPPAETPG